MKMKGDSRHARDALTSAKLVAILTHVLNATPAFSSIRCLNPK